RLEPRSLIPLPRPARRCRARRRSAADRRDVVPGSVTTRERRRTRAPLRERVLQRGKTSTRQGSSAKCERSPEVSVSPPSVPPITSWSDASRRTPPGQAVYSRDLGSLLNLITKHSLHVQHQT